MGEIKLTDVIAPAFYGVHWDIIDGKHTYYAIKSRIASTWKFSELGNKTILTYIMELKAKAPVFGTTSLIETRANSYKDTTVKFGKTFSKAPTVLVSLSGGSQNTKSFGVQVLSTTTSSCVIRTVNGNNSSVSIIVNWCALT